MKEYAIWDSARANRVYGSAGMKWQKGLKEGSTVVAWVDELMRHAPLLNANDLHVKSHGIDLLRYVLDPSLLLNATQVPSNADYYAHRFNGLQNMSIPKQTLAIFMSKPHFLDADANLIDNVVGMTPAIREAHDTMIDVEPLSGVTMRAAKRLQVNYALKPWSFSGLSGQFNWYAGVGKSSPLGGQLSFVPVAWVEESAEIDSDKAAQFRSKVYGAINAIKYVKLLGGIFGAVAVAVAVHMLLVAQSRAREEAEENFAKHHATNY
jgi:lysosome membrane protein 2